MVAGQQSPRMNTMKAIQVKEFGPPGVMQLVETPPPAVQPGQVRVAIQAAGVNPVDTYIRSGQYARTPSLPYIPGSDGAGVVEAVGEGVTTVKVGDRVYGGWPLGGTYAEFALYEASQVYPLPAHLSFDQGSCIFVPFVTAYRALFLKGAAQPGDTVLIHGATGGVGLAAVQWAVAAGLRVLGTGGTPEGRQLVLDQGAEFVFDHRSPDYIDALQSNYGEVQIVLEMLANVNLETDLKLLASGGRVVIIGSRGTIEITPRLIMGRESIVTGLSLFNTPPEEMRRIQAALQAGLRQQTLQPLVAKTLPLADAALAHEQVMSPGAKGNLVLSP